jgi:hypothetical protein
MAEARVLSFQVTTRTPVLDGRAFGAVGAYERLTGKVFFAVPVANPHNSAIVDLHNAVGLRNGEVAFSADFEAVRPKDPAKGNGTLIVEVPNRGQARFLALVDGGDQNLAKDAGDAWLLKNGYSVVALGWQCDTTGDGALRLDAPKARSKGRTITGLIRGDLTPSRPMDDIPLGHLFLGSIGGTEYPVAAPEAPRNTLTWREAPEDPPVPIPRSAWSFAHLVDGKLVPSDRHIHLNGGFQPGRIYQYIYVAKDPVVAGLGLAGVRDFVVWSKQAADALVPAKRVIGQGFSQDGRFLRNFLYQGFNADEDGRMALDGVLAHAGGAGRGSFNVRFAQPSRDSQPMSSIHFPTDLFPFTDTPEWDPFTGRTEGLLDRATADHVVPRIFFSNTSYEYWGRGGSLLHTDATGTRDLEPSANVRYYHFTGLQHFSGPFPPAQGAGDLKGAQPQSPLPVRFFWRAMIASMDAWVREGVQPPPSSHPRIDDGTLVSLDRYAFPALPGVRRPTEATQVPRLYFGPDWERGVISCQPPATLSFFPILVPQVDADGNELDGIHLPEIAVPLATYASWNMRDASIAAPGSRVAFEGSYLPFPKDDEARRKSGDPRLSIAERYPSREAYLERYAKVVDDLVKARWILGEDRAALLKRGGQEWDAAVR